MNIVNLLFSILLSFFIFLTISSKAFTQDELVNSIVPCKSNYIKDGISIENEDKDLFDTNFCKSYVVKNKFTTIDVSNDYNKSDINYFIGGGCPKGYEEIKKGNFYIDVDNQKITACGNADQSIFDKNFTNFKRVRFFEKKCPETFELIASTPITQFCKVANKFTVLKMESSKVKFTFEKRDKNLIFMVDGRIIKFPILFENKKLLISSMILGDNLATGIMSMMLDLNKKSFKFVALSSDGEIDESSGTFSIERLNFMKKKK
ncbi:MAG: hypothetical protein ACJZ80_00040 [Candidatus Puniceispirillales bacterium]